MSTPSPAYTPIKKKHVKNSRHTEDGQPMRKPAGTVMALSVLFVAHDKSIKSVSDELHLDYQTVQRFAKGKIRANTLDPVIVRCLSNYFGCSQDFLVAAIDTDLIKVGLTYLDKSYSFSPKQQVA